MKILAHICCGPCGMAYSAGLANENITADYLWFNPNIHPFTEYQSRKKGAQFFAETSGFDFIVPADSKYALQPFLAAVWDNLDAKCEKCYTMRLEYTAKHAAAAGYTAFTTTLLASPYQDFDTICAIGNAAANAHGIDFFVRDYRTGYRAGLGAARNAGIYMQKYCGCIFSEEERYSGAK